VRTLAAIEREDLQEFHARFFQPNNTILAVAGAVTNTDLRRLIEHYFGDWQRRDVHFPPVPSVPPIPSAGVPSVHHIEMDLSQSAIRLGHLGIDRYSEDRFAVAVMNHVLGRGGFTARLLQRLRVEEGIAYAAGSTFTLPRDTGAFFASTQTRSDQTVRAVRIIREEIERLRAGGLTEQEFADARSAILNRDIFRYTTSTQIVNQIAALEFDGYPRDQLERNVEAYRTMRVEDANAAARRYLHPDSLVVLVVGKSSDFDTTLAVIGPVDQIELERIE
jgi:predicted Zn-dependent peptidase